MEKNAKINNSRATIIWQVRVLLLPLPLTSSPPSLKDDYVHGTKQQEKRDKPNYSKRKSFVEIFWSRAKIMVALLSIDYRYSEPGWPTVGVMLVCQFL